MDKIKDFINKNKKTVIPIAVIILIIILGGICAAVYFAASDSEQANTQSFAENITAKDQTEDASSPVAQQENGSNTQNVQTQTTAGGQQQTTTGSGSSGDTASGSSGESSGGSSSESPAGNSPSGGSSVGTQGNTAAAHQHQWQEHKVWVSDIVTVVDEPEQVIHGAQLYTKHSDGQWYSDGETYWFENGFTTDDLKAIIKDKVKNEGYIGNYVNRTKTIPAKTHTEDHGSYQTDYYYCSCGARK